MKTSITMVSMGKSYSEGKMDIKRFIEFCGELQVDGVDIVEYYRKDKAMEIKAIPGWLKANKLALAAFAVGNEFTKPDSLERQKLPPLSKAHFEKRKDNKELVLVETEIWEE